MTVTHPYSRLSYGQSLAQGDQIVMSETLGVPLRLRRIPGTDHQDASGLYPISPDLRETTREALQSELQAMKAVCLVLVTDPLATHIPDCFDVNRPYKPHHVIDPAIGLPKFSKHHRAEVRRAKRLCAVRHIDLAEHLDGFIRLYDVLIARRGLGPQHRFDREHFEHLAAHPKDFPTIGAFVEDRLVSAHIWVRAGQNVYSHLAASDPEGYAVGAAYAVYDCAIHEIDGCRITLGGVPDRPEGSGPNTGLDRFKRGFANTAYSPHLCGIIADPNIYQALSKPVGESGSETGFFPLYRSLPAHRP